MIGNAPEAVSFAAGRTRELPSDPPVAVMANETSFAMERVTRLLSRRSRVEASRRQAVAQSDVSVDRRAGSLAGPQSVMHRTNSGNHTKPGATSHLATAAAVRHTDWQT